jgi:hypothetical protein
VKTENNYKQTCVVLPRQVKLVALHGKLNDPAAVAEFRPVEASPTQPTILVRLSVLRECMNWEPEQSLAV